MKRVVLTALAATLLCSTSALAQDARERRGPPARESGGVVGRLTREVAAQTQARETVQARPPAEVQVRPQAEVQARPQAAPVQARPDRSAFEGRRDDGDRGSGRTAGRGPSQGQTPLAGGPEGRGDGQRWDGQRGSNDRYDRNSSRPQAAGGVPEMANRVLELSRQQNQLRRDDQGRDGRDYRDGREESGRNPGWERDRGQQGRPPVVRPEDRRDRDWNRPRYDERRYPHYITPRQRFQWRGPIYRPPVGFYSYRWQFGQFLPWNWYTPNYYINDWSFYGLPMPPIGCEWVRSGDDAILVDVFTGRVYQVVYNLFW